MKLVLALLIVLGTLTQAHAAPQHPVSGQAVYTLTKDLLAAAPKRFNGSPGHAAAEKFIASHFAPEQKEGRLELDHFTASTPVGLQSMTNIIVKFPGKKDGVIVLASHYETNYPLKDTAFVGANDGACTSSLLIAIGEYLRTHPPTGYSVYLLFDDGEEAVANPPYDASQWGPTNNLYGTRHLAAKWSQEGTLPKIKALLVADMIGDKDLNINHDDASNPALLDLLKVAAKNVGASSHLYKSAEAIQDDTVPFAKRGVPVLDIIDIDYGPHNASLPDGYHHTVQDTLDKISPQSLQVSADLFMEMITLINQR